MQGKLAGKIAIVPLLIGSYSPDMLTKWFVYGVGAFGYHLKAEHTEQFHRGWPGVGFTHSLAFGVVVALLLWWLLGNKIWAVSFLIGQWLHSLTDTLDSVGTMLFFPFSTFHVSAGMFAYGGQLGRWTDAGAYFSGLGFVWDGVWVVLGLFYLRVITRDYFRRVIVKSDPLFWGWMSRHFSENVQLALFRASFFYGFSRWVAWIVWAHVLHDFPFDLSWGGPHWVETIKPGTIP